MPERNRDLVGHATARPRSSVLAMRERYRRLHETCSFLSELLVAENLAHRRAIGCDSRGGEEVRRSSGVALHYCYKN